MLRVRTVGDAQTVRGAVGRGVLRLVLLLSLGVVALVFSRDEPSGNRTFLWSVAGLLLVIAAWGVLETWREVRRLRGR